MPTNAAGAREAQNARQTPAVLVTREDPNPVCEAIRAAGGEAVVLTLLATRWMSFEIPHNRGLEDYDWVAFTSSRSFDALANRAVREAWNWPPRARAAAVGDRTAHELQARGWMPECVSTGSGARSLVAALRPRLKPGARVLFPCSALADSTLPDGLRDTGAAVDVVHVYTTETVWQDDAARKTELADQLRDALRDGCVPTCASPSAVRALVELAETAGVLEPLQQTLLVVLGPTTAAVAKKLGLQAVEADGKTLTSMARVAVETALRQAGA